MNYRPALALYMSIIIFSTIVIFKPVESVLADIPTNGLRQKIGDYDLQINTIPPMPNAGKKTNILISVTSSNSDFPLTDIPVVLKITKDGLEISKTKPIFISGGHFNYPHLFTEPGLYGLHIDFLNNSLEVDSLSNQITTFEFPLRVSDTNSISSVGMPIVILAAGVGIAYVAIRKHGNFLYRLKKRIA